MRSAVAIAIMVLVGLLAGLVLYILLRRAVLACESRILAWRHARLERAFEPWFAGAADAPSIAFRQLYRWPDRQLALALCLDRLPDAGPALHNRLVDWLETHGHVAGWIRALGHRDPWRRERAVRQLGLTRLPQTLEPLTLALEDPILDVRMRAARALGGLGGARARAALVAALTNENRWSAIRIADVLAEMGPEVVDDLALAFPTMARGPKLAAIDVIARVGGSRHGPLLTGLLNNADTDLRARAAAALGRIRFEPAVPALLLRLGDPAWPVRAMAAKALGALAAETAIPLLSAGMRDPEWWVRVNSAEALRAIGPAGLQALGAMRHDQDRFARDQAEAVLAADAAATSTEAAP